MEVPHECPCGVAILTNHITLCNLCLNPVHICDIVTRTSKLELLAPTYMVEVEAVEWFRFTAIHTGMAALPVNHIGDSSYPISLSLRFFPFFLLWGHQCRDLSLWVSMPALYARLFAVLIACSTASVSNFKS